MLYLEELTVRTEKEVVVHEYKELVLLLLANASSPVAMITFCWLNEGPFNICMTISTEIVWHFASKTPQLVGFRFAFIIHNV